MMKLVPGDMVRLLQTAECYADTLENDPTGDGNKHMVPKGSNAVVIGVGAWPVSNASNEEALVLVMHRQVVGFVDIGILEKIS